MLTYKPTAAPWPANLFLIWYGRREGRAQDVEPEERRAGAGPPRRSVGLMMLIMARPATVPGERWRSRTPRWSPERFLLVALGMRVVLRRERRHAHRGGRRPPPRAAGSEQARGHRSGLHGGSGRVGLPRVDGCVVPRRDTPCSYDDAVTAVAALRALPTMRVGAQLPRRLCPYARAAELPLLHLRVHARGHRAVRIGREQRLAVAVPKPHPRPTLQTGPRHGLRP